MSIISDNVHSLLVEAFPYSKIIREYYVEYKCHRLFVDFYLPSYSLAVEVNGQQHDRFVRHFHVDSDGWKNQKTRDNIKREWAEVNDITLVVINEKAMPKNKEELLALIGGFCCA